MEAKEILLNALNEAKQVGHISPLDVDNLLAKLTEISFKAGYRQRELDPFDKEDRCEKCYKEGELAGIKEVVRYVNTHLHDSPACSYKKCFSNRMWQSKLKEWEIE